MQTETEALNSATEAIGEAIDFHLGESVVRLRDVHMLIRSIFKARGTCGECEYFKIGKTKIGQGKCNKLGIYGPLDFSCSDFKRKDQ